MRSLLNITVNKRCSILSLSRAAVLQRYCLTGPTANMHDMKGITNIFKHRQCRHSMCQRKGKICPKLFHQILPWRKDTQITTIFKLSRYSIGQLKPYMGVSKNNATPKWMVSNGKPYFLMDDLGVFPYFWVNTHMKVDLLMFNQGAANISLEVMRFRRFTSIPCGRPIDGDGFPGFWCL